MNPDVEPKWYDLGLPTSPDAEPPKNPDNLFEVTVWEQQNFVDRVRESLSIKSHFQLLAWLQGEFQRCIPHQIFIAAWGDFSQGLVQYDVVSALPSVRTGSFISTDVDQFTNALFNRWLVQGSQPFGYSFVSLKIGTGASGKSVEAAFRAMRSVLAHGIRDERGRHDCLYAFLSTNPEITASSLDYLPITMPFFDLALRRIRHLPCQYVTETSQQEEIDDSTNDRTLSFREMELMDWVRLGKTNDEIGIILNISKFTVKNHLQRIFRKLDVTNRAHASCHITHLLLKPAKTRAYPIMEQLH
jgi:transcriptional regulator EpsA